MINIELMSKLYLVVAHYLNKARKARDGNKKKKTPKVPDTLKIGDNVLVRDHTSKAFQPKYKDFCITGLLGKNQVEIKDNHGHTMKFHHRDVKKIPMADKVCQLYEEEQIGKVRQARKAIPDNKMPDLGWDATEELETQDILSTTIENTEETAKTVQVLPETITAIAILIVTFLETFRPQFQEIIQIGKNTVQAALRATRTMSHIEFFKRITKAYRKTVQAITHATRMTSHTILTDPQRIANRNQAQAASRTVKQKLNGDPNRSYQLYYIPTPQDSDNQQN